MFDKLIEVKRRYEEINQLLMDPTVINDNTRYRNLMKEYKNLTPLIEKFDQYTQEKENFEEAQMMLDEGGLEPDFKEMVQMQYDESKEQLEVYSQELKILLLPKDENDDRDVIIEIRGGAGGEEAALFAYNLYRMYNMYADSKGWKTEILSLNETELGGFKEVSFSIEGDSVYSRFKFESGVHRVQRVPETESGGRIHTSAVTVAVLPEVEEVEFEINRNDLRIDVFRAGGPGGQCVNTTDSAVRITHIPTGVVVSCQDEKSQLQNKEKAMKILRSRIYEAMEAERNREIADERKSQVGSGDRSERIRTYNFPQSSITDHRINLTIYKLEQFLNGELDEVVDALITSDRAAKLSAGTE